MPRRTRRRAHGDRDLRAAGAIAAHDHEAPGRGPRIGDDRRQCAVRALAGPRPSPRRPRLPAEYIPLADNVGPAGALAVGTPARPHDLLRQRLDTRPRTTTASGIAGSGRRLRDFGDWLVAHGAPVGAVGLAGRGIRPAFRTPDPSRRPRAVRSGHGRLRRGKPAVDDPCRGRTQRGNVRSRALLRLRGARLLPPATTRRVRHLRRRAQPADRARQVRSPRCRGRAGPAPDKSVAALLQRPQPHRHHASILVDTPALAVTFAELFGRPVADSAKRRHPWGRLLVAE